ncbi:MAG TPA: T9SS type A sorting domain-containing protein [Cyclobacteriaceae bacterium]
MRVLICILIFISICQAALSQTCTVTGTSSLSWANPGPSCAEGGNAGSYTVLVIPAGFTVIFDGTADTWTGTRIDVYGTLSVTADVVINANLVVYSGGLVSLSKKLDLGSSSGCGYTVAIQSGGTIDVGSTGIDRLSICGVNIMKGAGTCNSCSGTNSGMCAYNGNPYCEPSGGFTGPLVYSESGYNSVLPIKLSYFYCVAEQDGVNMQWATSMQENFDKFVIQRSTDGIHFDSIGFVKGVGQNIYNIESKYAFVDEYPLIGVNYYRLKAIDLDYSVEYFKVVSVTYSGEKKIWVEPNPASATSIQLKTNFEQEDADRVLIYNNLGMQVFGYEISDNTIGFNTPIATGVYIVKYVTNGAELTTRALVYE